MSKVQKYLATLILLICSSLCCFSQTLQVPNFKKIKHNIDTLELTTYVDIKGIDVNNKYFSDTVFTPKLYDTISYMITNLLKNKYHLKQVSNNIKTNRIINRDFNTLFSNINMLGNSIPDIELPDSLFQIENHSRYSLITIFVGYYRTTEKVRKDSKDLMPSSLAVGLLSLGSLMVYQVNPAYLAMRIIVYDRIEKRVLYYNAGSLPGFNKVDYYRIKELIVNNFKTIYYK